MNIVLWSELSCSIALKHIATCNEAFQYTITIFLLYCHYVGKLSVLAAFVRAYPAQSKL